MTIKFIGEIIANVGKTLLQGSLQGMAMAAGAHVSKRAIKVVETRLGIQDSEKKDTESQDIPGLSLDEDTTAPENKTPKETKGVSSRVRSMLEDATQAFREGLGEAL